jgi:Type I phosphodiesterase / nucleotide pyrophosphatase
MTSQTRRVLRAATLVSLGIMLGCEGSEPPTAATPLVARQAAELRQAVGRVTHVLLISVDGLHALDLARFVAGHPGSALARLARHGVTFPNASAARPSDSYPGLLAMVTGGSPKSTGVFYDDSYDRELSPPGSNCSTHGTEVVYDESIDKDPTQLDAGGGIDPATLPLDGARGCTPVYPHQFLRVNTIFEVAKDARLLTAWTDKHPAYELVNGPSGHGVDDLFTPEIAATAPGAGGGDFTTNVTVAEQYDDIKVQAIVNEIDGKDHAGATRVGVPAIFGMNFQAVSVGEKTAGYLDGAGTPSAGLENALEHTDGSLGRMVSELERRDLLENTTIIVSAKHGQSPIDPAERRIVSSKLIPGIVNGVQAGLVAQATEDDIALLWLSDQSKTADAVTALVANKAPAGISDVLSGASVTALFQDPLHDSRTPDVIALVERGVIYTKLTATKLAEHGGFGHFDTNVPILVSAPGLHGTTVLAPVETRAIAPTILALLGLDPDALQAVRQEGTELLPVVGDED